MKKLVMTLLLAVTLTPIACDAAGAKSAGDAAGLKPRIVVLTDIAPGDIEPDDMESMVRLLVHADLFEIEGLVATSGWNSSGKAGYPKEWMAYLKATLDAYERDLPNLMKRSGQTDFLARDQEAGQQRIGYWPSVDYLRSRTVFGSLKMGYQALGDDNHSAGSDLIIKLADENDGRPLWITVWGGGNTLAQAVWKVQKERTPEQLKAFLGRLYVYTITDQDVPYGDRANLAFSSHQWLRKAFEKDLFFIWDESAWLSQNGMGKSNWETYADQIQNHGSLGQIYPKFKWGVEGDTPSFLHVLPNGLNDPTVANQVGWGGYFEWGPCRDNETHAYQNHQGRTKEVSRNYEAYFYPATFNNFAARMDWAKDGRGNRNPVAVVNGKDGLDIITVRPKEGAAVTLDASASYDPDGDKPAFSWWVLPEAGSWRQEIALSDKHASRITVTAPGGSAGKRFHVICEVTDDGTPGLTAYRRIIFEPVK